MRLSRLGDAASEYVAVARGSVVLPLPVTVLDTVPPYTDADRDTLRLSESERDTVSLPESDRVTDRVRELDRDTV